MPLGIRYYIQLNPRYDKRVLNPFSPNPSTRFPFKLKSSSYCTRSQYAWLSTALP